jgi:rare lipoprotein A
MRRIAFVLSLGLCLISAPAAAFFQGPWNVNAQRGTIGGYAKASTSRSCLTPQTRAVLAGLERAVGPVRIVSTCRPGAVIRGTGRPSQHRYGRAVDFNTRNKAAAIAWLRSRAFVMTYCGMSHLHFDTGTRRGYVGCGKRSRTAAGAGYEFSAVARSTMVASFYSCSRPGECSRSKRTANGERFQPGGMTAAHRTLPMGTRLRVCYRGCVVVRINDRGPAVRTGRSLDLSAGAARAIGMTAVGVARVQVSRL